jgi:hypothetical protein
VCLVTLTLTEGKCSDEAIQLANTINISSLVFDLPNVFTSNGDGTSDFFKIKVETKHGL